MNLKTADAVNVGHIIRGWGIRLGIIPTSQAEAKLADLRLKLCGACKYSQEKKILKIIHGEVQNNAELACSVCHCPCYEKVIVVDEECPRKRW